MSQTSFATLETLVGVFHDPGDGIRVYEESGPVPVQTLLERLRGRRVHLALHHLPPTPRVPDAPGAGACLWGDLCPCGHNSDPGWLYSLVAEGVLEESEDGTWTVSGTTIPLHEFMLGHRGRLVLFSEAVGEPGGVDHLLREADDLLGALRGLKAVLVEED